MTFRDVSDFLSVLIIVFVFGLIVGFFMHFFASSVVEVKNVDPSMAKACEALDSLELIGGKVMASRIEHSMLLEIQNDFASVHETLNDFCRSDDP